MLLLALTGAGIGLSAACWGLARIPNLVLAPRAFLVLFSLAFLAYGTREPDDMCYYPHSNKISFRGLGVVGRIERLDYWDGED